MRELLIFRHFALHLFRMQIRVSQSQTYTDIVSTLACMDDPQESTREEAGGPI